MDRTALSKRLQGFSEVFASGNAMGEDLKAMAHVVANMTDEQFSKIVEAGMEEATVITPSIGPSSAPGISNRPVGPTFIPSQPGDTDPMKAKGIAKMLSILTGKPEQNFTPDIIQRVKGVVMPILESKPSQVPVMKEEAAAPIQAPAMSPVMASEKAYKLSSIMNAYVAAHPEASEQEQTTFTQQLVNPSIKPEQAPAPVTASEPTEKEANMEEGLYWNKEASQVIVANLLRDVLGMDKTVNLDSGRHLTPEQKPEGQHDGVKAPNLKPEQTPDQEYLDSGIVEKSHDKIRKEAGDSKKSDEDTSKSEQTNEDRGDSTDPVKDVEKKEEEKKLEDVPVESSKKKASEAPVIIEEPVAQTFEGIELEASMDEVVMSDEEKAKLSALFN